MLLHLWKQPPGPVRYLKKAFTDHLPKNPLVFSINLTINNLVIEELFAETGFLRNASTASKVETLF